MKKFFKFGCLGVLGLVVLIIVISIASGGGKSSSTTSSSTSNSSTSTQKQETKKITLEDYNSIKAGDTLTGDGGDTYEDIVKKFGEPSTKSESESGGMKMIMAMWSKNINGDFGANFNVTFNNGKVSAKSQSGLK